MALDSDSKKTLRLKVEEADLALSLKKRTVNDVVWAEAQIELSEALLALADAEENDEQALIHYEEAEKSYESALQVFTKERNFSRWGGVIVSYVRCLRSHSLRENGPIATLRLKRGLKLLVEIFDALPQMKGEFDRALLYSEQGHVYRALADVDLLRERFEHIEHSIVAFDKATKIMREKENFHYWAQAVTASALACFDAAKMQKNAKAESYIDKAIASFETVLAYYDRDKNPGEWSYMQFELGRSLLHKAFNVEKQRLPILEQALAAFQNAKASFKHVNGDVALVRLQTEMAMTLSLIGQQSNSDKPIDYLLQSTALYQSSLKLLGDDIDNVALAVIYGNYGKDLTQLANLTDMVEESLDYRYQAIVALRKAICQDLRHSRFIDWLSYYVELGAALQAAANIEKAEKRGALFEEAIAVYNTAIELIKDNPQHRDLTLKLLQWRGLALAYLGETKLDSEGLDLLLQAEKDIRKTIEQAEHNGLEIENIRLNINLSHLLYAIARRPDSKEPIGLLQSALTAIEHGIKAMEKQHLCDEEEKISALSHQAVILWRLGSYGKMVEYFDKAQNIYMELLQMPKLQSITNNYIRVQSNYALMLRDWALQVKPFYGVKYLQQSAKLLQSIRSYGAHDGESAMVAQIDDDLRQIEQQQKSLRRKLLWRFWPFG